MSPIPSSCRIWCYSIPSTLRLSRHWIVQLPHNPHLAPCSIHCYVLDYLAFQNLFSHHLCSIISFTSTYVHTFTMLDWHEINREVFECMCSIQNIASHTCWSPMMQNLWEISLLFVRVLCKHLLGVNKLTPNPPYKLLWRKVRCIKTRVGELIAYDLELTLWRILLEKWYQNQKRVHPSWMYMSKWLSGCNFVKKILILFQCLSSGKRWWRSN